MVQVILKILSFLVLVAILFSGAEPFVILVEAIMGNIPVNYL